MICTRDRADLIGQAVVSIVDCDHDGIELHVMDQSTDDSTQRVVRTLAAQHAEHTTIVYHHLEVAGLSRAYNAGFRATTSQIVACTDDDVIVHRDWIRAIERAFATDDRLGALYGQVKCPESLRDVGPEMIVPALTWTERLRLFHTERNYKVWGMGANMAIRRRAFDAIGGFDELMGGGAPLRSSQDFDFSLRLYRGGWAVLLDPDVQVDHYGAAACRPVVRYRGGLRHRGRRVLRQTCSLP